MAYNEIRITNIPPEVLKDLRNIAKNSGITLSAFLKPKLRKITAEYPAEMKIDKKSIM